MYFEPLTAEDVESIVNIEKPDGEGEITSFIKDMYQNAEIDAFDISEKVIAEAQ